MKKGWLFQVFLVCIGIVFGTLVARLTAPVSFLNWLSYALSFGLPTDFNVNLQVIQFSIGLQVNLSVSVIIFIVLSLVVGNAIAKK